MKKIVLYILLILSLSFSTLSSMAQERINVLYTIDNNYCVFSLLSINSILEHNESKSEYYFYIVEQGLTDSNKQRMKDFIEKRNQKVFFINIDSEKLFSANIYNHPVINYITSIALARLFASEILPEEIDKLIYLDSDTLILSDLKDLYDIELDKYYAGLVVNQEQNLYPKTLYDFKNGYYNSGVMLINLKKWRQENLSKIFKNFYIDNVNLFTYKKDKTNVFRLVDQDLVNIVLDGKIKPLDLKWNQQFFLKNDKEGIVHYIGKRKPWKMLYTERKYNKIKDVYMENWNKTPELKKYKFHYFLKALVERYNIFIKFRCMQLHFYLNVIYEEIVYNYKKS